MLAAHRCRTTTGAHTITRSPVDKYVARPDALDDVTYYFLLYDISKTEKHNVDLVGADTTGASSTSVPRPSLCTTLIST